MTSSDSYNDQSVTDRHDTVTKDNHTNNSQQNQTAEPLVIENKHTDITKEIIRE